MELANYVSFFYSCDDVITVNNFQPCTTKPCKLLLCIVSVEMKLIPKPDLHLLNSIA